MSRTPGADDPDQLFIDTLIALGSDIVQCAQAAKGETDDPDILYQVLLMESAALIIQKRAREYRDRLMYLKRLARSTGADIRIANRGKSNAS